MIIVVKNEYQHEANQWFTDNIDPEGGMNTFTIPLYNQDSSIYGYWCGIVLTEDVILPDYMTKYDMNPNDVLNELGVNLGNDEI